MRRTGDEARTAACQAATTLQPGVVRIGGEPALQRRLRKHDASRMQPKLRIGGEQYDEQGVRDLRILLEDRARACHHVFGKTRSLLATVLAPPRAEGHEPAVTVTLDPTVERRS